MGFPGWTRALLAAAMAFAFLIPMMPVRAEGEPYMFDIIQIDGLVEGDIATFNYSASILVEYPANASIHIIGPPMNVGITCATLDGNAERIRFSTMGYYITPVLSAGTHWLNVSFEYYLGGSTQKRISFDVFGPALRSVVNVRLPHQSDGPLIIDDRGGASISGMANTTMLSWRSYAFSEKQIGLSWTAGSLAAEDEVEVSVLALLTASEPQTTMKVHYILGFPGKWLEQFPLPVRAGMEPVFLSPGFIWDAAHKRIELLEAAHNQTDVWITFTSPAGDQNITIPHPAGWRFSGTLVVNRTQGMEAGVKESFGLEARPVRDCWPTSVLDPIGAFSLGPDFWIYLETRAMASKVDIQVLLAAEAGTQEITVTETLRINALYRPMRNLTISLPPGLNISSVSGPDFWHIGPSGLEMTFEGGIQGAATVTVSGDCPPGTAEIAPLLPPPDISCRVFFAAAPGPSMTLNASVSNSRKVDISEIPAELRKEVRFARSVSAFEGSAGSVLVLDARSCPVGQTRATMIEYSQVGLIATRDWKLITRAMFLVKNVERQQMRISVPPMCSLWYLMVSGSVVPAIASGGNITVPLLRSDIGGANVAYPVEVMYVEGRRNQSLRFSLPTTDVDTSAMEVKLAVPAGFFADDARGSNPGFDYLGSAPWKVAFPTLRSVGSTSSVHGQSEYSNGILAATSAVAGQGQGQGQCQGQGQGQGNVRFTDTKGGKAGSADVNIYQASAPASSFDGLAVSKVSTVNLSSPSTEVALQAGQYFATWGDQTLNFQVGAQMDQQIILGSSSGGSGLDLLPAGLNFPGKGTVLMFTKILTNANESLFLTLEERSPSASRPAYILVGLGILAIAIAAIAAVAFQKSRSKGVAYAKANVPSSSTVKPKKKHVRRVENHIGATEGSALATEGSASVEGHFEERSKEYKNP